MKNSKLPNARSRPGPQFAKILRQGAGPALRLLIRPGTLAQLPRLFVEGFAPARRMFVQAHNDREMARLIREKTPVTYVCSFARSGNTWMRYLVSDVLLQNLGIETTTDLPIEPAEIIPDYYEQLIARRNTTVKTPGCMIKTHDLIPMLQKRVGGDAGVRQCRYLYLFRMPEDALVSFFHLYLREKFIRSKAGGDIDLFCLEALPGWLEHVSSYLDAADEGLDVHLVSYEELLRQPLTVLSETLRWLGIPHTPASVMRANSNMQFSNLQALEARTLEGRIPFFRRGRDGSGILELEPDTVAQIRAATKHLVARANDSLARQGIKNQVADGRPAAAAQPRIHSGNGQVELAPLSGGR
jgi:hypothetical protein